MNHPSVFAKSCSVFANHRNTCCHRVLSLTIICPTAFCPI